MFILGIVVALLWRVVRARGHALFGVVDDRVQNAISQVVGEYTSLKVLHDLHTGPTHQRVFSGGTVVAWFERIIIERGLPKNVRAYVVWGAGRRRKAATELVVRLVDLGFK